MADPFAVPADLEVLLKVKFDQAEEAQCLMVLAAVSAAMRSRLPNLDTWITDGSTDEQLAKFCAINITKNFIDVTDAGNVKSEAHPEHTITFKDVDPSDVDVPGSWIDLLTPHQTREARGRAFSIRPGSG